MKIKGIEIELQEYNNNILKDLINDLRGLHKKTATLCNSLEEKFIEQKELFSPTIIRLSKWCNTGGPCVNAEPKAQEISRLLFGMVLPRLDEG